MHVYIYTSTKKHVRYIYQPQQESPISHRRREKEMDRVLSVDEISDQFWSSSPPRLLEPGEQSMMNRSESEWAFQCFLQEQVSPKAKAATSNSSSAGGVGDDSDVVEIKDTSTDRNEGPSQNPTNANNANINGNNNNNASGSKTAAKPPAANAGAENIPIISEEYRAFLKRKLNLACAAVALSRVLSLDLSLFSLSVYGVLPIDPSMNC